MEYLVGFVCGAGVMWVWWAIAWMGTPGADETKDRWSDLHEPSSDDYDGEC